MDASFHEFKKKETPSAWTRILAPDASRTVSLCSFAFARSTRSGGVSIVTITPP
jgi:hypothetical protein